MNPQPKILSPKEAFKACFSAVAGYLGRPSAETVLFADPLVFVCRTPHPLQDRQSITWSDLRDTDLVGVSSFVATRLTMDYQLAKRNLRVQVKYEVQHHATAVNLVAAGVASTILPSSTIREGDRPGIRKIALGGPTVKRRVVLLRARQGSLSPAAEAFHALIRKSPLVL